MTLIAVLALVVDGVPSPPFGLLLFRTVMAVVGREFADNHGHWDISSKLFLFFDGDDGHGRVVVSILFHVIVVVIIIAGNGVMQECVNGSIIHVLAVAGGWIRVNHLDCPDWR